MAIEAKATLLNEMERALATEVTAAELTRILTILTEKLDHYDLTMTALDGPQQDDLLDAYLSALAIEGRSKKTIERYRYLISRMMDAVRTPTRKITVYHLRRYLADEKARGISDRTLESTRQVFSAFFNWLQRERLIDQNPTANLGVIKYQKKEKDVYSEVDIERMKFGCKSLRDRAIIYFLESTGCRINEVVQLNRDDINFSKLECKVLGKGNKERTVYLNEVAAMMLQTYLDQRTDDLPALFIGKGSERMHAGGVRAMLCKLGAATRVAHVHPHRFRRTLATNLIRRGMAIQEVAAILGHDKLDTTMKYVVLNQDDVQHSYQKFS